MTTQMQNASDFQIFGTSWIHFDREHLRGTADYLTPEERVRFADERIAELTKPDGGITRSDTWYRSKICWTRQGKPWFTNSLCRDDASSHGLV